MSDYPNEGLMKNYIVVLGKRYDLTEDEVLAILDALNEHPAASGASFDTAYNKLASQHNILAGRYDTRIQEGE